MFYEKLPKVEDTTGKILPLVENVLILLDLLHQNNYSGIDALKEAAVNLESSLSEVKILERWEDTEINISALGEFIALGFGYKSNTRGGYDDVGRYLTRYPEAVDVIKKIYGFLKDLFPNNPVELSVHFCPEGGSPVLSLDVFIPNSVSVEDRIMMEEKARDFLYDHIPHDEYLYHHYLGIDWGLEWLLKNE